MDSIKNVTPQESVERWPRLGCLIVQGLKFGIVGIAATVTHVIAFFLWIEVAEMRPLGANIAAFCVAVTVGFTGHFYWTFRPHGAQDSKPWKAGLVKFAVVSLSGLALYSLAVYIVVNVLALPYLYAVVLMLVVVPPCTFILSKFWAFA
jgi:putative flippase GtrA